MGRAKTGIMRTTKGEKGLEKLVHLAKGLRKGGGGEGTRRWCRWRAQYRVQIKFKVSSPWPSYEVAIVVPSKKLSLGEIFGVVRASI